MDDLKQATCVPCRGGVPPLTAAEIAELRPHAPAWNVVERDGILRLERAFAFKDFRAALDFTVEVGELAEREQHHPDIHLVSYKKVIIELFTHAIEGLSENDFIVAAKINSIWSS